MKKLLTLVTTSLMLAATLAAAPHKARAAEEDVEYFKQFLYSAEEFDPGQWTYRYLSNSRFDIPNTGGQIQGDLALFLHPDNTVTIRYTEYEHFFPAYTDEMDGTWSVPEKNLIVGDIGVAERYTISGQPAVKFTFTRDIHTPGLKGLWLALPYVFSNIGLPN